MTTTGTFDPTAAARAAHPDAFVGNIDADWLPDDHGGYPATIVDWWNGWAVAVVTRAVMERMVDDQHALAVDEPTLYPDAYWDGDTAILDWSFEDPDEPWVERYAPYPSGPYAGSYDALGARGMCWQVAVPAERVDAVARVFRAVGIGAYVDRVDGDQYRLLFPDTGFTVDDFDGNLTARRGDGSIVADFDGGWYPQPVSGVTTPSMIAAWVVEAMVRLVR